MMRIAKGGLRSIWLALVPVAGVLLSAAALGATLSVYMDATNVPDGALIMDCNTGVYIRSEAYGYDGWGNKLDGHSGLGYCHAGVAAYEGTTTGEVGGTQDCSAGWSHKPNLVEGSTSQCTATSSGQWLSSLGTGQNIGVCSASNMSVKYTTNNGTSFSSCVTRTVTAYSLGN